MNYRLQHSLFEGITLEVEIPATGEFEPVASVKVNGTEYKARFLTAALYELESHGLELDEFANSAAIYYLRFASKLRPKMHRPSEVLELFQ